MPFETVVRKTIEYLAIPSVVGHEKIFMAHLYDDFFNLGLDVVQYDKVLEISGKQPYSNILSAHIDRHGLISMGDGTYAYAAEHIKTVRYDEDSVSTKSMLNSISERFEEEHVFAYDPETGDSLGSGCIERAHNFGQGGDAYFSITGMADVRRNIPVAYARNAEVDEENLKGQIDNVVSLGIIYTLFQNGFQGTAVLTVEEEIGKSWIYMTDWLRSKQIDSKRLFILDTSPYRESDPVDNHLVVLRTQDKSGEFNSDLLEEIKTRCNQIGLDYQVKDEYFLSLGLTKQDLGSTELGRIVENTEGRWNGVTLQIPTTEYHTSYETTSRGCIESYYALLSSIFIEDII